MSSSLEPLGSPFRTDVSASIPQSPALPQQQVAQNHHDQLIDNSTDAPSSCFESFFQFIYDCWQSIINCLCCCSAHSPITSSPSEPEKISLRTESPKPTASVSTPVREDSPLRVQTPVPEIASSVSASAASLSNAQTPYSTSVNKGTPVRRESSQPTTSSAVSVSSSSQTPEISQPTIPSSSFQSSGQPQPLTSADVASKTETVTPLPTLSRSSTKANSLRTESPQPKTPSSSIPSNLPQPSPQLSPFSEWFLSSTPPPSTPLHSTSINNKGTPLRRESSQPTTPLNTELPQPAAPSQVPSSRLTSRADISSQSAVSIPPKQPLKSTVSQIFSKFQVFTSSDKPSKVEPQSEPQPMKPVIRRRSLKDKELPQQ